MRTGTLLLGTTPIRPTDGHAGNEESGGSFNAESENGDDAFEEESERQLPHGPHQQRTRRT